MLRRFWGFLYGDVPVRFPSDFALMESVERLRSRTKRSVFSGLFRQAAVGVVNESKVRLQRVIPFFGNGFKPIFVGRFHYDGRHVFLEGRFTMLLHSKIFTTVWLSFALLLSAIAAADAMRAIVWDRTNDPAVFVQPLIGLGFFLVGVGLVRGCWWLSRKDMSYLASVIQAALSRGPSTDK